MRHVGEKHETGKKQRNRAVAAACTVLLAVLGPVYRRGAADRATKAGPGCWHRHMPCRIPDLNRYFFFLAVFFLVAVFFFAVAFFFAGFLTISALT
jgi:hypothetical protein